MRQRLADLPVLLDRWVAEGIITDGQAERIRSEQAGISPGGHVRSVVPAHRERGPLVTEALGYLGGVLILVAAGLLTARFWEDMPLSVRLAVVAGAAVSLFVAGAAVSERLGLAGYRLRSVLWLLCVGTVGAFLALLAGDGLDWQGEDVMLLAAGGAAVFAGALWSRHPSTLQQLGVFVALSMTVAAAAAHLPNGSEAFPGLSIWGIAVIWMLLGWGDLVTPRRSAYVIGGIGALFGSSITATQDWGLVLALATAAALVGVGVLFRDLLLLAVGAVGALLILPGAIDRWFPGALAAPLVLLVAGGVLVGVAVHTGRSHAGHEPLPQWAPSKVSPGVAVASAVGVAVAVTAIVLTLGLN